MKKTKKTIFLGILILIVVLVGNFVNATEVPQEGNPDDLELLTTGINIAEPIGTEDSTSVNLEVISDDVYKIEENTVISNKQISGNVYIVAQDVSIENSYIDGNLFVVGQNVKLKNSAVLGSSYVVAQSFETDSAMRDSYIVTENVKLEQNSYVDRSVRIVTKMADIDSYINNGCYLLADEITIGENTIINGNFAYTSTVEATIPEGAKISNVEFSQKKEESDEDRTENKALITGYEIGTAILKCIVIVGLLLLLAKKSVKINSEINVGKFFKALGIGLLIFLVVPIVSILLMITVVGVGIGIVLLVIYGLMLYVSTVYAAFAIGCTLGKDKSKWYIFGYAFIIYLILRLLSMVTGIGVLVSAIMGLAGLGFIASTFFYKEKKNEVIEEG